MIQKKRKQVINQQATTNTQKTDKTTKIHKSYETKRRKLKYDRRLEKRQK